MKVLFAILVFPVFNKLDVKRPEKFGGNVKYSSYAGSFETY